MNMKKQMFDMSSGLMIDQRQLRVEVVQWIFRLCVVSSQSEWWQCLNEVYGVCESVVVVIGLDYRFVFVGGGLDVDGYMKRFVCFRFLVKLILIVYRLEMLIGFIWSLFCVIVSLMLCLKQFWLFIFVSWWMSVSLFMFEMQLMLMVLLSLLMIVLESLWMQLVEFVVYLIFLLDILVVFMLIKLWLVVIRLLMCISIFGLKMMLLFIQSMFLVLDVCRVCSRFLLVFVWLYCLLQMYEVCGNVLIMCLSLQLMMMLIVVLLLNVVWMLLNCWFMMVWLLFNLVSGFGSE